MPAARDFTTVPCSTVQKMQVTCRWRLEASGSYVDRRYGEQALVAHMRSLVVGGEQPGTYGSRRAARGICRAASRRCTCSWNIRRTPLVKQCGQQCGQPAQTTSKTVNVDRCIFQIGEGNRGPDVQPQGHTQCGHESGH